MIATLEHAFQMFMYLVICPMLFATIVRYALFPNMTTYKLCEECAGIVSHSLDCPYKDYQ